MQYLCSFMTVNVDNFSVDKEEPWGKRNMIIMKGTENSMYRASKKRASLKENCCIKITYTKNQKQTTEISYLYDKEVAFERYIPHRVYWRQAR